MFPGVGSQCVGMGEFFYDNFKVARDTFEEAGEVLAMDFTRLCFSKSEEKELSKLENSQLALVVVGVATFKVLAGELGIEPRCCLGHSLGEYTALCSAGVLLLNDTLLIVKERGKLLSQAAATMDGIMAWIINLDTRVVDRVVAENTGKGVTLFVSAYDSPTQSSISGPRDSVLTVGRQLEKEGAIVYPLKLSGPFHSPLMRDAVEKIKSVLKRYNFNGPRYPVIANRDAGLYSGENVVDNLSLQLTHPILWRSSLQLLVDQGVDMAVEVGPDKVLKHLMVNTTSAVTPYSMENAKDLDKLKEALEK